ncbi:hypothetical protein R5R35_006972 [Gryllus longicercus]|uniref:Uncharacterized protein n=1 Tax=Gryllus longicercus TaxID=2509291 RepID=A0AAN9Z901_9ORTH
MAVAADAEAVCDGSVLQHGDRLRDLNPGRGKELQQSTTTTTPPPSQRRGVAKDAEEDDSRRPHRALRDNGAASRPQKAPPAAPASTADTESS